MNQATQQDIESWLWESANILRGPVDPANLRDFVFPLLFLKRLSDAWDEEQKNGIKEFGSEISEEVAADFHRFQIPDGCHWSDLRKAAENQGVLIQKITQKIEEANPELLAQIFGNAPWADHNKMPPERLERLIAHFSQQDLSPSKVSNDLLGGGYESSTSAGQFFTPRAVVHLLVRILGPQPTDSVYDPACGSAGMLIEAATEVKQSGGSVRQMRFFGQEVNQTSAAIGRMNLFIHDVEDAQIRREDTLQKPKFVDSSGKLEQFDVVVANPPFSLKDWGAEKWAIDPHRRAIGGVPPKNNGDYAWVQHMITSMRPITGRVGVVMPHGVLFRTGTEGAIRKFLIESDLLETVIGLAPNLFYGTTIPASLMFFRATKEKERPQNALTGQDVEDVFAVYASKGEAKINNISAKLVSREEIAENNFDLNIGRYLKADAAAVLDVRTALDDFYQSQEALTKAEAQLLKKLKAAGYA
jgi:type I restriction enzyme M protein